MSRLFVLSLLLLVGSVGAAPGPSLSKLPINIVAEHGEYDGEHNVATYTGHVVMTQGEMKLTGDRVLIHLKNGRLELLESWGDPATFHWPQKRGHAIDAQGRYLKYLVKEAEMDIDGKAQITQNGNTIHADNFVYLLNSKSLKGQKVSVSFLPSSGGK